MSIFVYRMAQHNPLQRDLTHDDLTPCSPNKFRGFVLAAGLSLVFASVFAPSAVAQVGDLSSYQGPGILSPGVGDVGMRSGQQVDLRYYGGVSGFYDTNPQAVSVDANGNLIKPPNLYGVELDFGAYGSHDFRTSKLSLDYRGDYRHSSIAGFDSSDHTLTLGYTYQASRRVVFDLRESVGTLKYGYGSVAAGATGEPTAALNTSSLFFDTRTYYAQSTAAMTILASAKTSFTVSGSGFLRDYNSGGVGLANTWGYTLSGSVNQRISKSVSLGALYQRTHFESSGTGSQSTSNAYFGTLAAGLGRFWTFSLQAGVTDVDVVSPFTFALSPLLAAILGTPTLSGIAEARHYYPSGIADLTRTFEHASIAFHYDRQITSGNGLFTTARTQTARAVFSYTGIRRVGLNVSGGYNSSTTLDQSAYRYEQYSAGAGMSYNLGHDLQVTARYDLRDQQINAVNYSLRGSRTTVGLLFSPGKTPLSLW
jgi:hypothetical protein